LQQGISGNEEDESRRLSRGRMTSAAAQSQLKEDLEERERQLGNAVRAKDDIETRLEESRVVEEELRGELISAKNGLANLKSQDMNNFKALEEAQDKSERLLNKVRRRGCRCQSIQGVPYFSLCFPPCRISRGPCAFRSARPACKRSKNLDRSHRLLNLKSSFLIVPPLPTSSSAKPTARTIRLNSS
jgi:DNA repair exonuclease SbcCD ATPase subunit